MHSTPLVTAANRALPTQIDTHAPATQAPRHPAWVIGCSSLWLASLGNLALWHTLKTLQLLDGVRGWAFGTSLLVMLTAATMLLLGLVAWRWTLKPAITALLFISASSVYFMLTYGVVIDATMIRNVFQTDRLEAAGLVNPWLFATLGVLAVAPAVWLWRTPVHYGHWPRRAAGNALLVGVAAAVVAGALFASFQTLSSTVRNHKEVRYQVNPFNTLVAVGSLANLSAKRDPHLLLPLGEDVQLGASYAQHTKPPLLVLVLGETGRSGNFGTNGYGRDTTPELAREQVASFRDVWSCGTSTAASVPCMFSHLQRSGFEGRSNNHENLLDVVQRAGLAVLWVDNQAGCKGVCDRVPTASTTDLKDPELCVGESCYDGMMLKDLDARIAALPAERRARGVVVVLHQIGSHGPAYFERSPAAFKRFLPECTSNALQNCSREELVNAYDNTIAYTDHFLASTVQWLKARSDTASTAMVYVADHGESLGENNLYLHGMPYALAPDVQKHVPWITWLSPGFEQRSAVHTDCLRQQNGPLSHDNYFHSVLGLLDLKTSVYQRPMDVYARCADGVKLASNGK
ncbi:MAG: phosphoethanolamine--lipid A transferase [Pseudomonadota bacterium]